MENISFDENGSEEQGWYKKRRKQLVFAGVGIIILIAAISGWQYWQYISSPYYQQMQAIKKMDEMFSRDQEIGGKTPEETAKLFGEALKNQDIELAMKYMTGDWRDRENMQKYIEFLRSKGVLQEFIDDLLSSSIHTEKFGWNDNELDIVIDKPEGSHSILTLAKNSKNFWKILLPNLSINEN